MDFKNLNLRAIILLSMAGLLFLGAVIKKMATPPSILQQKPYSTVASPDLPIKMASGNNPGKEIMEEDTQSLKEMKEQMDSDRLQQKKIKILKLQLEQTKLQLEQEKALSEIGKLEKTNTSIVNDSNDQGQDRYPDVKVVYIGGTPQEKEAILSINGNNYSVKEKNKPFKNMEVISITDTAVTVHFNLPQDLMTTIEYKPE